MHDNEKIINAVNKLHELFLHIMQNKSYNPTEYASILASFIGKASNHMLNILKVKDISDRSYILFQIQDAIHRGLYNNLHREVDK